MLARISHQAAYCRQRATECRRKSALRTDAARVDLADMAMRWERLAVSYELAERLSGFIEWRSNRLLTE